MFKTIIQKPSAFPLSASYMLNYLRADEADEALIKKLIARAFSAFTDFTNGCVAAPTTYSLSYNRAEVCPNIRIELPVRPIASTAIVVNAINEAGDETALYANARLGDKYFRITENIPSDTAEVFVQVEVGFTEDNIPDAILSGIEQYVAFLYENRGCADNGAIPDSVALLWLPYVRFHI